MKGYIDHIRFTKGRARYQRRPWWEMPLRIVVHLAAWTAAFASLYVLTH